MIYTIHYFIYCNSYIKQQFVKYLGIVKGQ